ncbi:MAG: excinuclease ABC subunit UvrC [Syntrophobacteraceae bacterium]
MRSNNPSTPCEPQTHAGSDADQPCENAQEEKSFLGGMISGFPHLPGVYLFRDQDRTVIYVGKALDLRKRVGSYFRGIGTASVKTRALLSKATDLEYVVTSTEKEAFLLEASFIKKYRPRYNVILRDDKNYPALRIDSRDPFPRLEIVRRFQKDGALYFGPYPSGYAVRETLRLLNRFFPLRQCKGKNLIVRKRPCLNYSLGRCLGACAGKISQEDYGKMVDEVILFLQGKTDVLQQQLQQRMAEASANLEFERAAFYRDRLKGIASMLEKQHIVSDRFQNRDVLGIYQEDTTTEVIILFIRQGVLIGQRGYSFKPAGDPDEVFTSFIQQYYGEGQYIPDEILVPVQLESEGVLEEWLTELKGRRVRVWPARRGERRHLLELAASNARQRFLSRRKWQARADALIEGLQRVLKLPRPPVRMACVDISNIQGRHAVGALVVFMDGRPEKSSYRHYRIESKHEPDDPAMMAEVVERLLTKEPELGESLDLLVLDGGKGQLGRIHHLMKELGAVERLPVIALAKEQDADIGEKGRGFYEKIYLPGRKNPLFLSKYPDLLHLLMRLRDEAHRFAISHYKNLHRNELIASALDSIKGVGAKRRQILLQQFGSLEALQKASVDEIDDIPGISRIVAENIKNFLQDDPELIMSGTEN